MNPEALIRRLEGPQAAYSATPHGAHHELEGSHDGPKVVERQICDFFISQIQIESRPIQSPKFPLQNLSFERFVHDVLLKG
jgi:hypothetical protein